MKFPLQIIAGPEAQRRLRERGFDLDLFDTFIGASGGPKWLTLFGLDRVLSEALASRSEPIQMIGSSIGAVRIACYAQENPVAAFDRFVEAYLEIPEHINPESLRDFVRQTVRAAVDGDAPAEILANPTHPLHIVAARCEGIASNERLPQLGMVPAGLLNFVGPEWMSRAGVSRSIFATDLDSPIATYEAYVGDRIQLSPDNLEPALHASGSIPGFSEGVSEIPGARPGVYRDGGIVDYHFNPSWHRTDGLILYPHFAPTLVPVWFDNFIRRRHLDPAELDRLVLLTPSPEFIASLPHGKIPDRHDAVHLDSADLRRTWTTVAGETERLGEALQEILHGDIDFFKRDRSLNGSN